MKIVFTGDIHLGASDHMGRENAKTRIHSRLEDFLRSFDSIIDYVIAPQNNIDAFVIAGDLYKNNAPTNIQRQQFSQRLALLSSHRVHTYIIDGNHDVGVHIASANAPLSALSLPYIHVYCQPAARVSKCTDEVGFVFIPYQHKDVVSDITMYYDMIKEQLSLLDETQVKCKIIVGHQTIEGTVLPNKYNDLTSLNEIVVPQQYLADFDLAVYGHIHNSQVLGKKKQIVIPGSIENNNLGEIAHPKHFIVYDTQTHKCVRVPLPVRDVYDMELDLIGQSNIQAIVMAKLAITNIEECVVKLMLKLQASQVNDIDEIVIKKQLERAWYNMGLFLDIEREHRSRNEKVNEKVEPFIALQEYLSDKQDINDIKQEILCEGKKIILFCNNVRD